MNLGTHHEAPAKSPQRRLSGLRSAWLELKADLKTLRLSASETRIFLVVFTSLLVAKAGALLPLGYATDDMSFAAGLFYNNPAVLDQGRFTLYILRALNHALGIQPTYANVLTGLASFGAMAWASVVVCRRWRVGHDVVLGSLAGMLFALHPYTTEYYTFKTSVNTLFYEYVLTFLALHLARDRALHLVTAAVLIALALGKNQLMLNILALVILFALLLELARGLRHEPGLSLRRAVERAGTVAQLIASAAGVALYLLVNRILPLLGAANLGDEKWLPLSAWAWRRGQLYDRVADILVGREVLITPVAKSLILLFLVLAVGLLLWRIIRARAPSLLQKIALAPALLSLLAAAGLSVFGVTLVSRTWYTAYRVLSGIGLFLAGVVVLVIVLSPGRKLRRLHVGVASVLLVSFAASSNRVLTEQMQTNARDFHKANRIVMRLETDPGFSSITALAIIGGANAPAPLASTIGDLNQSAFSRPWSQLAVLRAITGYQFSGPTAAQQQIAREYCANSELWPHPESIQVLDDLGVICLAPRQGPGGDTLRALRERYGSLRGRHAADLLLCEGLRFEGLEATPAAEDGTSHAHLVIRITEQIRTTPVLSLRRAETRTSGHSPELGDPMAVFRPPFALGNLRAGRTLVLTTELRPPPEGTVWTLLAEPTEPGFTSTCQELTLIARRRAGKRGRFMVWSARGGT